MQNKTLQELQLQIAEANLAIAKLELEPLKAINFELAKIDFSDLMSTINTNAEFLTAERKQQALNIVTVLSHSPTFLLQEANNIDQMVNAQEASALIPVPELIDPPVAE